MTSSRRGAQRRDLAAPRTHLTMEQDLVQTQSRSNFKDKKQRGPHTSGSPGR